MSEEPWEGRCYAAAHDFAVQCATLRDSNPYEPSALECVIIDLATELWDRGFSQTEIRRAFGIATGETLTRYGAGEDRRDDKLRR